MSLPIEFLIENAVGSIGDLIIYRAEHPIHGTVSVYQLDDNLPSGLVDQAKKRLYQTGLQMRDMSLQDLRFVTKALEVSQNPNEPYVVTEYTKYDLNELINNGITLKPKRVFLILSQVLEAIINLAAHGRLIDRIHARQIKLPQLHTGNLSYSVIEETEEGISGVRVGADLMAGEQTSSFSTEEPTRTVPVTERIDEEQILQDKTHTNEEHPDIDATSTDGNISIKDDRKQLRNVQRNVYILGDLAFQLLFGRKYVSSDKLSAANKRELGGRWRKVLERALSEDAAGRYDTYEQMLSDIRKASNRNKRLAIASVPFLIVLAIIVGYFSYERYREHKIMTSEAGKAIEDFLEIVNKTQDEFPELIKPEVEPNRPDEQTILSSFDNIKSVDED
jgi:serine/threonine protein kinase